MSVIAGGGGKGDKNDNKAASTAGKTTATDAPAPAGATVVTFAYSPEKEAMLTPLVKAFNASGATTASGRRVFVKATAVASGDSEHAIAKGTSKPVAWSPASS